MLRVSAALDEHPAREDAPKPAVRIEFADTGRGLTPQALEHLFEPFFTTKPHGMGLGLSISYGIIAAHGGLITAASQPGAGSTFTIWLPAEMEASAS